MQVSCIGQVGFQWGGGGLYDTMAFLLFVSFLVNGVSTTLQKLIGNGSGGEGVGPWYYHDIITSNFLRKR